MRTTSREPGTRVRQSGFTIYELMIVVAIISILAVMALPAYLQYTTRSQVGEGLSTASPVLLAVAETFQTSSQWPESNEKAGVSAAPDYASNFVDSIAVGSVPSPGAITVTYRNLADVPDGATLVFVPSADSGYTVTWSCSEGTMPDWARPSRCR